MTTDLTPHRPGSASTPSSACSPGPAPAFPRRFGRYILLAPIAAGGMAEVFVADQTGPHGFSRRVALKRIHAHLAQEAGFIQSFLDEARLGACLRHPHVVQIQDLEVIEGVPVAAMEYVEGGHFGSLLARARALDKALPEQLVVELILQVARGLEHAHAALDSNGLPLRLIHRDLKPSNLLLGFDGFARIVDFGIARASSNLAQTAPDVIKGSVPYMAPEQASGEPLSAASDLFSLGAVFYELLTLKRLHQGDTQGALLIRAALGPSPEALSRLGQLRPALGGILRKLLAVDPAARFASASELLAALEDAGHTPVSPARLAVWAREWLVGVRQPLLPAAERLAAFKQAGGSVCLEPSFAPSGEGGTQRLRALEDEGKTPPWVEPVSVILPPELLSPEAGAAMTVTPLLLVRPAAPGADVPNATGQSAPPSEPWGTSPDCLAAEAITGPLLELVPGRRQPKDQVEDKEDRDTEDQDTEDQDTEDAVASQKLLIPSMQSHRALSPTSSLQAGATDEGLGEPGMQGRALVSALERVHPLSLEAPHTLPTLLPVRAATQHALESPARAPAPASSLGPSGTAEASPVSELGMAQTHRAWARPLLAVSMALAMLVWGSTRLIGLKRGATGEPSAEWGWVYVLEPTGAEVSLRARPLGPLTYLGVVPLRFRPEVQSAEVLLELKSPQRSLQPLTLTRITSARAILGAGKDVPQVLALPSDRRAP